MPCWVLAPELTELGVEVARPRVIQPREVGLVARTTRRSDFAISTSNVGIAAELPRWLGGRAGSSKTTTYAASDS